MSGLDPIGPDAQTVHYDLSEWSINQRADVAAALADAEIVHSWDVDELLVAVAVEDRVDAILDDIEAASSQGKSPSTLSSGERLTEYELDEWSEIERNELSEMLTELDIAFRWEADVLLVSTSDEDEVDECLDALESGGVVTINSETLNQASNETLQTLSKVAQRLQRNPLDADGLTLLSVLLEDFESHAAPRGVPDSVWRQATGLADQLAAAIGDDNQPDEITAIDLAGRLHAVLRPHV